MKLIRDYEIEHCMCVGPELMERHRIYLRRINDIIILIQGGYNEDEHYEIPYVLVENLFKNLINSIELKEFVYQVECNLRSIEENKNSYDVMCEKKPLYFSTENMLEEWTIINHDHVEPYFAEIDTNVLVGIACFIEKYIADNKECMNNNRFMLCKSSNEHYWSQYISSLLDYKEILSNLLIDFPSSIDQDLLDFINSNTNKSKIEE